MSARIWTRVLFCTVMAAVLVGGIADAGNIARNDDGSVDCSAYANYAGRFTPEIVQQCGTPREAPQLGDSQFRAPTDTGYAVDIYGDQLISWTLNDWPGQTVVAASTLDSYAMDFDQAATTLWAMDNPTTSLGTIDLATGAFTTFSSCVSPATTWSGMTIDPSSGNAYASTTTELYSIDLTNPADCTPTLIGAFGTGGGLVIEIAMNAAGQMYAHDIGDDSLYSVDPATGASTLIGASGYDANYAQGMDFDHEANTLYAFLLTPTPTMYYGTFDLATGAFTVINTHPVTAEHEGAIQIAGSESLSCGASTVEFETGIPLTFTVVDNTGGTGCVWSTTADAVACPRGNIATGVGEAACADSDAVGTSIPYDTELVSNTFSLAAATSATLSLTINYQDLSAGNDFFHIDIWNGASWDNLLDWDEDHGTQHDLPGEYVVLDLSAYAGMSDLQVRFHYAGDGYDWYAYMDDVNVNCSMPAVSLTKLVDTVTGCPGTTDEITVAPGTDVYYCYTMQNIGNVAFDQHDLDDDQLGNLFTGDSTVVNPGESMTYETGPITIAAPTVNVATWSAYQATGGPDVAASANSATVNVNAPAPISCNGQTIDFGAGIPPDWTVNDNAGNGVIWLGTGAVGYPTDCGEGNYTAGTGIAACVSSDTGGYANYDSELIPPTIDFTGFGTATLFFESNYQDISGGGDDRFDIDVSFDGGGSWTNALSWDEDHGALNTPPGESVMLDLTALGVGGQANVMLRFHNYSTDLTDPWDWYAQVDDILLECIVPVELQSFSIE